MIRRFALAVTLLAAGFAVVMVFVAPTPDRNDHESNPAEVRPPGDATANNDDAAANDEMTAPPAAAVSPPGPKVVLRNVTPDGVLPGPPVTGPLTRVEPPPPPPEPDKPPEPTRFFRIGIASADTLILNGKPVRLAGVAGPPLDATCRDAENAERPCGRQAMSALTRLIRGRAVECLLTETDPPRAETCTIVGRDIAAWLVTYGWALPDGAAPDRFAELSELARAEERGLWRYPSTSEITFRPAD